LVWSTGSGTRTQLAQFDAVVCTQVAEYIPDVNRALSEAFRVVKRGGRPMFFATDWDAVVWHSETPDRMVVGSLKLKGKGDLRPTNLSKTAVVAENILMPA